jgi:hypothetical protein
MDRSFKLVMLFGKVYRSSLKAAFDCMKENVDLLKEVKPYIHEMHKLIQEEVSLTEKLIKQEVRSLEVM